MQKIILTKRGLVAYDPSVPMTVRLDREETTKLMGRKIEFDRLDDHCEIVHIEVTPNCNRSCVYCYNPKNEKGLSTASLCRIFGNLARAKVFQISFGGGEPFMRKDVFHLAWIAKEVGLNVCATTNGDLLAKRCEDSAIFELLRPFGQINVSYHGDNVFFRNLGIIAATCEIAGVKIGINFCCQDGYMDKLETVAQQAAQINAELLLLSYKPVVPALAIKGPSGSEIVMKAFELASKYKIDMGVDGSCVRQCMASMRFCDIHPNGDVSVCSFKREPIGNVLREDFRKIWVNRPKEVTCPYFKLQNKSQI